MVWDVLVWTVPDVGVNEPVRIPLELHAVRVVPDRVIVVESFASNHIYNPERLVGENDIPYSTVVQKKVIVHLSSTMLFPSWKKKLNREYPNSHVEFASSHLHILL
jgi:hypothetical protein